MQEVRREVVLAIITGAVAAAILIPVFLALQYLMTLGLEYALVAVLLAGLLLGYAMRKATGPQA